VSMTDAELAREVAVKVMGYDPNGFTTHFEPMAVCWADAGRVIERMKERGWGFDFATWEVDEFHAVFYEGVTGPRDASADTGPRAVFMAALRAVEGSNV